MTYLQHHLDATRALSAKHRGLLYYVVRCWSQSQELFDDDLVYIVGLQQGNREDIGQYEDLLRAAPRATRYALLRLLILHTNSLGAKISVEEELRSLRVEKWPCNIFTGVMGDQAASLLRVLTRVKPEGSFLRLGAGNTILTCPQSPGGDYTDPLLLLTLLQRG